MAAIVDLALDCRAVLGESPVCDASGAVSFVDISGKAVHRFDSVAQSHWSVTTPQAVGCIVPRAKGGFLAALEEPIVTLDLSSNAVGYAIAAIPDGQGGPDFRFNDGKCDPSGRFWVGTMCSTWRDPKAPPGRLYVLDPNSEDPTKLQEKLYPTKLSNGLAWSSDNATMFWIDSFYRTVDAFDFNNATGEIANRRTVLCVSEEEPGPPDGMAIDSNGKLWVVVGESGTVRQYDPETGVELARVSLPVQRPTSCAFGGKDLSELYVTTREEKGNASPHAGGLFRCRIPGVKGASFAVAYAG